MRVVCLIALLALALVGAAALLLANPGAAIGKADAIPRASTRTARTSTRGTRTGSGRRTRGQDSGTPVTNFRRSTRLYHRAMSYNRGLDRDKDGIACEKA